MPWQQRFSFQLPRLAGWLGALAATVRASRIARFTIGGSMTPSTCGGPPAVRAYRRRCCAAALESRKAAIVAGVGREMLRLIEAGLIRPFAAFAHAPSQPR